MVHTHTDTNAIYVCGVWPLVANDVGVNRILCTMHVDRLDSYLLREFQLF